MNEVRALQDKLKAKLEVNSTDTGHGEIKVNGPLPFDFSKSFAAAVSLAEGVPASSVKVVDNRTDPTQQGAIVLSFEASKDTWLRPRKMYPILSPSLPMARCTVFWSPLPNLF